MKKIKLTSLSLIALAFIASSFVVLNLSDELAIGTKSPKADVKMMDVSGKEVSFNDVKTAKGLLVIFSCNTCPYVKLSESRIKENTDFCNKNGIGSLIINSNEAQRDADDSFDAMKKYAGDQKLAVPYVLDKKSEMADAFGATRTPQCFLFDAGGVLVYKGAIDDNVKDTKAVKQSYLKDALMAVLIGAKPGVTETKSIGCTIKRLEQN